MCIAVLGGIIGLLLLATPFIAMNLNKLIPYVHDSSQQANMAADALVVARGIDRCILMIVTVVALLWILEKRPVRAGGLTLWHGGSDLRPLP